MATIDMHPVGSLQEVASDFLKRATDCRERAASEPQATRRSYFQGQAKAWDEAAMIIATVVIDAALKKGGAR